MQRKIDNVGQEIKYLRQKKINYQDKKNHQFIQYDQELVFNSTGDILNILIKKIIDIIKGNQNNNQIEFLSQKIHHLYITCALSKRNKMQEFRSHCVVKDI